MIWKWTGKKHLYLTTQEPCKVQVQTPKETASTKHKSSKINVMRILAAPQT